MTSKPLSVLVCGTRVKSFKKHVVYSALSFLLQEEDPRIIEGCCPDSADVLAEEWAAEHSIPVKHVPGKTGRYLQRNTNMVNEANYVLAFWDGYSYGTAQTIAYAVMTGKDVKVIRV